MYKYYLLDVDAPPIESTGLVAEVYEAWKKVWNFELGKHGEHAHTEEFARSQILAVIVDESSAANPIPVAFHLYTGWRMNLPYHLEHPYFRAIPDKTLEFVRCNCESVMTMEYLTVLEAYRKKFSGVSFAEILISLGLLVMENSPWQAAIGTSRIDRKIDGMSAKLGCSAFDTIQKYDYACVVNFTMRGQWEMPQDKALVKLIKELWETKKNLSSLVIESETQTEAA